MYAAKDKNFNATLQTDLDTTIGKMNVVPQEIGRVFLNLFNNAIYSGVEKKKQLMGTIYRRLLAVVKRPRSFKIGYDQVEIKVKHNGIGIIIQLPLNAE